MDLKKELRRIDVESSRLASMCVNPLEVIRSFRTEMKVDLIIRMLQEKQDSDAE